MRLISFSLIVLLFVSCSTTKRVVSKTETTETVIEQTIDTTVTVTPPPIVVTTSKDSLISSILRDSVYVVESPKGRLEIASKNGKVTFNVKPAPVDVVVKENKKITVKQKVTSKDKDVKRTNYAPFILCSIVLLGVSFIIYIFVVRKW